MSRATAALNQDFEAAVRAMERESTGRRGGREPAQARPKTSTTAGAIPRTPRRDGDLLEDDMDMVQADEKNGKPEKPRPYPAWARPSWLEARFGVGAHTLQKAWKEGKLRRAKLDVGAGGTVLYPVSDVEAWIEGSVKAP